MKETYGGRWKLKANWDFGISAINGDNMTNWIVNDRLKVQMEVLREGHIFSSRREVALIKKRDAQAVETGDSYTLEEFKEQVLLYRSESGK